MPFPEFIAQLAKVDRTIAEHSLASAAIRGVRGVFRGMAMLDQVFGALRHRAASSADEGIGTRLVNSVVGVLVGAILFFFSFIILWKNEGNVIAERGAVDEMRKVFVKVSSDAPSEKQSGKLVFTSGALTSNELLGDPPFIKPGNYLALDRHVEMYQWTEKKETNSQKRLGGSKHTETVYSYSVEWAPDRIDSSQFKITEGHENPPLKAEAKKRQVAKARLGKFDATALLTQLEPRSPLIVTASMTTPVVVGGTKSSVGQGGVELKKYPLATQAVLGDERITYTALMPGPFSVMAKQSPKFGLGLYKAKNGKEKLLVEAGAATPTDLLGAEKAAANTVAAIFRVIGFLCMWIGMNLLAGPITTLLDVIPFLGSAGRFVLGAIFFVVAAVLSLLTIAVAMIAHHPVTLLLAIAAAGAGIYHYMINLRPRRAARLAAQAGHAGMQRRENESDGRAA